MKAEQSNKSLVDDGLVDRFTWEMKAATSRWGILCDVALISIVEAVLVVVTAGIYQLYPSLPGYWAAVVLLVPPIVPLVTCFALRGARRRVVDWAGSLPFPVENINAVLSGAGEFFDLHFVDSMPSQQQVNALLDEVSREAFVLEVDEKQHTISCRFGLVDNKFNIFGATHQRYARMQLVMSTAMTKLHAEHPLEFVQML